MAKSQSPIDNCGVLSGYKLQTVNCKPFHDFGPT
jgi:hypothetical protein